MLIIGLTGGIGSGKSTVANLFAAKGITVIDTDQLAREVTEPGTVGFEKIIQHFGKEILLENNKLDRSKLRHIVFNNDAERIWLEQLLHPLIRNEIAKQIATSLSPYTIVVIPLLFETTPNPLINRILVVDATEEHQIARTVERDKATRETIQSIMNSQVSRKERLAKADDVINNHGDIVDLQAQVDRLHEQYLS